MNDKFDVKITRMMKQDLKHVSKRGNDLEKLNPVVVSLGNGKLLDEKYKDHALKDSWRGYRECHIEPDWLLIYKRNKPFLYLARTGTHGELFKPK